MGRVFIRALAAGLAAFVPASAVWASHIKYVGTTYPLRWGQKETSDLVTPYPVATNPVCFKVNSTIGLQWIADTGDPPLLGWTVKTVTLKAYDGTLIWQYTNTDTSNLLLAGDIFTLPTQYSVPSYIMKGTIQMGLLSNVGPPSGAPQAGGISYGPTNLYAVLDTPKAQMSNDWIPVLDLSCVWAYGDTTAAAAAKDLTESTWRNAASNAGSVADTTGSTDTSETFYLKAFLVNRKGECNDIADFLLCCMHSVGGYACTCTRSYSVSKFGPPTAQTGWSIETDEITPAGGTSPAPTKWGYHQFVFANSGYWDGCLALLNSNEQNIWAEGWSNNIYETSLVDWLQHSTNGIADGPQISPGATGDPWAPTGGFVPTVTAADLPKK